MQCEENLELQACPHSHLGFSPFRRLKTSGSIDMPCVLAHVMHSPLRLEKPSSRPSRTYPAARRPLRERVDSICAPELSSSFG
jgi:hypothetical protein